MRVSREKSVESRERILEAAASLFREKGFDGIGLVDIMKAAGLTHGGFYNHFGSKEDLEAQALGLALARSVTDWSQLVDSAAARPLAALAGHYLTPGHRENAGEGCPFAALGADTARRGEPVRSAFTAGLESFLALLSNAVPGRSKAQRRRKAIATLAVMVGAIILARAVNHPALSDEILAAGSLDLSGSVRWQPQSQKVIAGASVGLNFGPDHRRTSLNPLRASSQAPPRAARPRAR